MTNKDNTIDWNFRFKSICNFCKNYDNSPVLKTSSTESVIINKRLETIARYLHADLDPQIFDFTSSKGSGKVPKAPWVAINLKGKKVSNSISFVICFSRTGEGVVLGLMSPSQYKSTFETVKRTKIEGSLLIDYKDLSKYDDRFINPIELRFDDISIEKITNHKVDSCLELINKFSNSNI